MNVDLIPGYYYWDTRTPSDGKPGPIYLAIMTEGMAEPYPDFKVLLHHDSSNHYSEVMEAMESLEMYAPELFDTSTKNAQKFRDALEDIIHNFSKAR